MKYHVLIAVAVLVMSKSAECVAQLPDQEEIAMAISENQSAMLDPEVEFKLEYERYYCSDPKIHVRYTGGLLNSIWTIAQKNGFWSTTRVSTNPKQFADEGYVDTDKPYIITMKNGELFDWRSQSTYASVDAFDEKTNIFGSMDFFRFVGFNAPKAILGYNSMESRIDAFAKSRPDDWDWPWLPDCLKNGPEPYAMERLQDGNLKLDNGWDMVVLNPKQNYSVVKRKTAFGKNLPMRCEIRNSSFKEVKPGLWLPMATEEILYAKYQSEDRSLWNQVAATTKYRIKSVVFSNVGAELFTPKLPVGVRVLDTIRMIQYEVTGPNVDPFSEAIDESRRVLEMPIQPRAGWNWWKATIAAIVFLVGLVLAFVLKRRLVATALLIVVISGLCSYANASGHNSSHQTARNWEFDWSPKWRQPSDCGPNACYIVAQLNHVPITLNEVKLEVPVAHQAGASLHDMAVFLQKSGLRYEPGWIAPTNITDVVKCESPVIVHTASSAGSGQQHFMVLLSYSEEKDIICFIDPTFGKLEYAPANGLRQLATGYILHAPQSRFSIVMIFMFTALIVIVAFGLRRIKWSGIDFFKSKHC